MTATPPSKSHPPRPHPPTSKTPYLLRPTLSTFLLLFLLRTLAPAPIAAAPAARAGRTLCTLNLAPAALVINCAGPVPVTLDASNSLLKPLRITQRGNVVVTRTPLAKIPACGNLVPPRGALLVLCAQTPDLHLVNSTITSVNTAPSPADPSGPTNSTEVRPDATIPEGLLGARAALAILLAPAPGATEAAPSALTITNFTAKGVGGGTPLFVALGSNTSLHVIQSTFADNSAPRSSGGGLALQLQPPAAGDPALTQQVATTRMVATLFNITFTNNTAFCGGGLSLQPHASRAVSTAGVESGPSTIGVWVEDSTFEGNTAVFGGGLYAFDSNLTVTNSVLRNNIATWYGGGAGMESMQAFLLRGSQVVGNRAGHYGGGMFGAGGVGNTFNTMMLDGCTISDNLSEMQGGGIFLQRGSTTIANTPITNNVARQQGGGIAFLNLCDGTVASSVLRPSFNATSTTPPTLPTTPTPLPPAMVQEARLASCSLQLTGTTRVLGNSALAAGGGLYVAIPGSRGVDLAQVNAAVPAANNSAPYSPGVSALPGAPSGIMVNGQTFVVSSSTGPAGVIPLTATIGQYPPSILANASTQLALQFCDNQYLSDSHSESDASSGPPFLLRNFNATLPIEEGTMGVVDFMDSQLRLLSGKVGRSYCLQVYAPDYPDVPSQRIQVTIEGCRRGEKQWVAGCLPCSNLTYSLVPNATDCKPCDPDAICDGGAVLVPKRGFWHSASDSDNVQPCPNRKACQRDRTPLLACQAAETCPAASFAYQALQCSNGYTGNLCGSCDKAANFGQGLYFQCAQCMPKPLSVVLLLALGAAACGMVVFVSRKALAEAQDNTTPSGGVVLVVDAFGGSWKAASSKNRSAPATPTSGATPQPSADGTQGAAPLPLGGGLPLSSLPAAVNREVADIVRKLELSDVFKVLVLHLQHLSIISNLLLDWPRPLRVVLGVPRLLFFSSSSEIVSWDCLGLSNGAMMALPILLPLLLVLAAAVLLDGAHTEAAAQLKRRLLGLFRGRRPQAHLRGPPSDCEQGRGPVKAACEPAGPLHAPGPGGAGRGGGGGAPAAAASSSAVSKDTAGASDTTGVNTHSSRTEQSAGASSSSTEQSCSTKADRIIATLIVGVSVFYLILVSTSLSAFACIKVDGTGSRSQLYWIKDMSVQCGSREHLRAALAVGVLGVLVFCLLLPAATIWWLSRNRSQLSHVAFKRRYGFLYRLYRPRYCFWEGVVCLQTTMLVSTTLFARGSSTYFQLVLLSGMLVLNYTLVSVLRPFRCRPLQWLYIASTVTLLTTSLGAQLVWHGNVYMREVTSASGLLAMLVMLVVLLANVTYVLICLYIMGRTAAKLAHHSLLTATTWVVRATSRRPNRRRLDGKDAVGRVADMPSVEPPSPLRWPKPERPGASKAAQPLADPGAFSSRTGDTIWPDKQASAAPAVVHPAARDAAGSTGGGGRGVPDGSGKARGAAAGHRVRLFADRPHSRSSVFRNGPSWSVFEGPTGGQTIHDVVEHSGTAHWQLYDRDELRRLLR